VRVKGRVALVAGEDWQLGRVLGRSVSEGGVSKVYAAVHNAGDWIRPPTFLSISTYRICDRLKLLQRRVRMWLFSSTMQAPRRPLLRPCTGFRARLLVNRNKLHRFLDCIQSILSRACKERRRGVSERGFCPRSSSMEESVVSCASKAAAGALINRLRKELKRQRTLVAGVHVVSTITTRSFGWRAWRSRSARSHEASLTAWT